jgi:hypothetical protein
MLVFGARTSVMLVMPATQDLAARAAALQSTAAVLGQDEIHLVPNLAELGAAHADRTRLLFALHTLEQEASACLHTPLRALDLSAVSTALGEASSATAAAQPGDGVAARLHGVHSEQAANVQLAQVCTNKRVANMLCVVDQRAMQQQLLLASKMRY